MIPWVMTSKRRFGTRSAITPPKRAKTEHGERLTGGDDAEGERGVGQAQDEPCLPDPLHPGADHRDDLAEPEEPVVRVPQRAESLLQRRARLPAGMLLCILAAGCCRFRGSGAHRRLLHDRDSHARPLVRSMPRASLAPCSTAARATVSTSNDKTFKVFLQAVCIANCCMSAIRRYMRAGTLSQARRILSSHG